MQTLFLDFGSHAKTVAFVRDGKTVSVLTFDERPEEALLLPRICSLLEENGGSLETLHRIAMVSGPGGFMSLRTGMSIGNALAWSLKIPAGGILLPDLHEAMLEKSDDVIWLHSTKKDLLFAKGLGKKPAVFPDIVTIAMKDVPANRTYVGELMPEHAKTLALTPAEKAWDLSTVLPALLDTLVYADPPLLPWYGRGI